MVRPITDKTATQAQLEAAEALKGGYGSVTAAVQAHVLEYHKDGKIFTTADIASTLGITRGMAASGLYRFSDDEWKVEK
ncbi:MAG: hypothetical protein ACREAS_06530, partial [Nitrososphaera sp.]